MELKTAGKNLITDPIKNTFVQGECAADVFEIILPKSWNGLDLSAFSFKMRGASAKNTLTEQLLTAAVREDCVVLTWTVTSDFTAVSGSLSLELVGVSGDGTQIIKFPSGQVNVQPALTGEYAPPSDLIEQALAQMQTLAAKAAQYVGKSAYDLWLVAGNAGTQADFLASLHGKDGTNLKILGSFESAQALSAAYPDGKNINGGFMVADEYYYWSILTNAWASAGCLQGAKGDKGDTGAKGDKGDSGKAAIVTDLTATAAALTVQDNTEYRFGTLTSLDVTFPAGDFCAFVTFTSGAAATAVTFPVGTRFLGFDVLGGTFTPAANTRYSLGMWHDGVNAVVAAGGC